MSFQLSILKILAGQPDGRATIDVVKQHLAIFYTSGSEWTDRMKRLAERAPELDLFGQKLVVRDAGVWCITPEGRAFLVALERPQPPRADKSETDQPAEVSPLRNAPNRRADERKRRGRRRRRARERRSA